nr:class A beta-lactamase, subclass A2 [Allomuricauda sp.]
MGFHLAQAQSIDVLRQGIHRVLQDKSATVGVAIKGPNPKDTISVNGNMQLPMQSVFKFHLALAVLHQVDQGKLDVKESIPISKETMDTYGHLWSPLRKKYPDGAKVPLAEVIQYTVALSDNVGCDLLFERIGGTEWVQSYLHGIGIKDIAIKHVELAMQAQWDRQYENWTTAKAANQVLQSFFENHNAMLSTQSHDFLLDVLKGTKTGKKSIRGLLPENLVVAHKTGHSGKNDAGLTGAVNDIGIVFLPDGSHFYISVLVSNSMESDETNQRIIAEIAKLTWDYFTER